jgi:hypothetical protein
VEAADTVRHVALLAVAALTSHQPAHLGRAAISRAAIGGTALACFYLALSVIPAGGMGLGDVFPELARASWQWWPLRKVTEDVSGKAAGRACRGGLVRCGGQRICAAPD